LIRVVKGMKMGRRGIRRNGKKWTDHTAWMKNGRRGF